MTNNAPKTRRAEPGARMTLLQRDPKWRGQAASSPRLERRRDPHARGLHFAVSASFLNCERAEFLRQVLGIVDDGGHDQPRPVVVWKCEAVEEFLDGGALAVRHSVRPQVPRCQIRGDHFERSASRGSSAPEDPPVL